MIEVIIRDTKGNLSKMCNYPKQRLLNGDIQRMIFVHHANRMIGEFLQELKEEWKEENK